MVHGWPLPSAALTAGCSRGALCHHVKREASRFIPSTLSINGTAPFRSAVGGAVERYEIRPVTHHSAISGALFVFRLPSLGRSVSLRSTQPNAFRPLRCIGWDVAVTHRLLGPHRGQRDLGHALRRST